MSDSWLRAIFILLAAIVVLMLFSNLEAGIESAREEARQEVGRR